MATIKQIQFKRSNVAGKRPLPADIAEGELAINIKDATMFTKNADGAIIDLGFAKGGQVDGNINQVSGNFTTVGDIKGKNVNATTNIVAETGEVRSNAGVLRTKAAAGSNSHIWFDGAEVTGTSRNSERAVIYANSQTTTSGGAINYSVFDKSNDSADGAKAMFHMYGTGDFDASRDINASRDFNGQRAKLSVFVQTPQVVTNNINSNASPFQTYGWEDLRTYTTGNGVIPLNYVYKGRAHQAGTIWHQLLTEQKGFSEWTLYTGSGPEFEQFSIKNGDINGGLGLFKNSLAVGDFYSTLGKGSIAIGDSDTGFRSDGDGAFSVVANNSLIASYNAYDVIPVSYKKAIEIVNTNGSNVPTLPSNNSALLKIDTSTDGNNASGNGLTLIGYNADNKYHHYFRGNGKFVIQMTQGAEIVSGGVTVTGNSKFNNNLTAHSLWSEGDTFLTNTTRRHIVFRYTKNDGTSDNDGYIFKDGVDSSNRRPGIRISASTPNKTSGNTQNSGEFVFDENGNFVLPSNGTIVQDYLNTGVYAQSLLHNGPAGNKNYLRKFRGGKGDTIWHETVQGGLWRLATGSTDFQEELQVSTDGYVRARAEVQSTSSSSGGQFRAVQGNYGFFIRNDGGSTYFMLTNSGDPYGSWNGLRPLTINNGTGQVSIGTPLVVTHYSGLTVTSTAGDAISWGDAGACLTNDGNLKGSRWKAFGGADWAGDALNWVHSNNLSLGGGTMTGALNMNANINMQGVENRGIRLGDGLGTGIFQGRDSADNDYANIEIRSWYGVGFKNTYNSGAAYYNKNTIFMNLRDGTMQAYNVYIRSDKAYKENIKKIESATDKVNQINGYTYNIKDSNDKTRTAGVIAQEVEKILPEAVTMNDEGKRQVNYNGLIALLVNSVNELTARVKELEAK